MEEGKMEIISHLVWLSSVRLILAFLGSNVKVSSLLAGGINQSVSLFCYCSYAAVHLSCLHSNYPSTIGMLKEGTLSLVYDMSEIFNINNNQSTVFGCFSSLHVKHVRHKHLQFSFFLEGYYKTRSSKQMVHFINL